MTLEHPTYWLAYLAETVDPGPPEITATAPCILDRPRFTRDARVLLAAADAFHTAHPHHRVVFAAEVTRWLHVDRGISWNDLEIDFFDALADLELHAAALLIEVSPIARAVVANAAMHLQVFAPGGRVEDGDVHTEPVREAIRQVLERDWPPYIRRIAQRAR